MKNVKVSIVIPVYNAESYLTDCIESIINQSYQNIEIILVDDGSTDNSGSICDNYAKKDNRIKVIHEKNSGVSTARNSGIKASSSGYVNFIDSDDIVHSDYIKKLVENVNSDLLPICRIEEFQDRVTIKNEDNGIINLNKDRFIELCKLTLLNTPCCKLYNLDIIRNNNICFDTKLSLGEDLLFNLDYLKHIDKIVIVDQVLYYYRRSESNTLSTAYNPKMPEIQSILFDKYTDFFKVLSMDNSTSRIYDSYRYSILAIMIENEFKNKSVNFLERCLNVKKILKDSNMKKRINSIHNPNNKFRFLLIKHHLILTYKIVNKIKSII